MVCFMPSIQRRELDLRIQLSYTYRAVAYFFLSMKSQVLIPTSRISQGKRLFSLKISFKLTRNCWLEDLYATVEPLCYGHINLCFICQVIDILCIDMQSVRVALCMWMRYLHVDLCIWMQSLHVDLCIWMHTSVFLIT